MPDDIRNWKEIERERLMLIADLDQVAAKIAEISLYARCVAKLSIESNVSDTILCTERDRISREMKAAMWKLRTLIHQQKRIERAALELRREELDALNAAIASLEPPAPSPSSQGPQLKGGL